VTAGKHAGNGWRRNFSVFPSPFFPGSQASSSHNSHDQIRNTIGSNSEKPLNNLPYPKNNGNRKEVIRTG